MKQPKKSLLIVEDDAGLRRQLCWGLEDYEVTEAADREAALAAIQQQLFPVVTLDLGLPPDADGVNEGFATLEQLLILRPDAKVIVVTGRGDHAHAVRAIGLGAYDFYQKPLDIEVLKLIVARAHHLYALEEENRRLMQQDSASPLQGVVAASPQMLKVCRMVEKVGPADVTTLLLGDSGTGKEVLAHALHALSARSDQRFVAINCAAIPDNLLESELFGYEKGAFTGASKQKQGKIEYADSGTLFLDEIGDLSQPLQAKLLRFIQERVIERLGGNAEIPVDVRVICATNQDLDRLMQEGTFREDLYYRISELSIHIPPLRQRDGDILLLARTFLDNYARVNKRRIKGFSTAAMAAMEAYEWPGNVRELENKIKRAVILADGEKIDVAALGILAAEEENFTLNLQEAREQAELLSLQRALGHCNGNVSRAAELLGISRPTCYSLLSKYGLK